MWLDREVLRLLEDAPGWRRPRPRRLTGIGRISSFEAGSP
jgi:hypothetical protein